MSKSTVLGLVAVLAGAASLPALYLTAFYTWVTATPVTPSRLERVRALANGWGLAFLACAACVVVAAVLAWRARR